MNAFKELIETIRILRSENGCSWDRKQTLSSMTQSLIEETYELVESIDQNNNEDILEETGDLLFLASFVGIIAEEEKRFQLEESIRTVNEKLIRRHPHVFGDIQTSNDQEIIKNWEEIKSGEKKNQKRKSPFDGIPKHLPPLQRLQKILNKISLTQNIPQPDSEKFERDLKTLLNSEDSAKSSIRNFLRSLMYFCHHHEIDLSSEIRKLSDEEISRFYSK